MAQQKKKFPATTSRGSKRDAGATGVERTPLAIRTKNITISAETEEYVRKRLAATLEKHAERIERLTVRFEDVNGPRGGVDVICRANVVLSGLPSVVVDERGETDRQAFGRVASSLTRAVRKTLEREPKSGRSRAAKGKEMPGAPQQSEAAGDEGSLIGRRVGQGPANLAAALERPEKKRRDQPVDTSQPGVAASDRKAGYGSTARRNTKADPASATAALEDSQTEPSRKSTRKSANRAKSATSLHGKAVAASVSPTARSRR